MVGLLLCLVVVFCYLNMIKLALHSRCFRVTSEYVVQSEMCYLWTSCSSAAQIHNLRHRFQPIVFMETFTCKSISTLQSNFVPYTNETKVYLLVADLTFAISMQNSRSDEIKQTEVIAGFNLSSWIQIESIHPWQDLGETFTFAQTSHCFWETRFTDFLKRLRLRYPNYGLSNQNIYQYLPPRAMNIVIYFCVNLTMSPTDLPNH